MTTAILSALPQEQAGLLELLVGAQRTTYAGRDIWRGELHGQPVVLALSRIGKVAAATTSTLLIERFGAKRIVFTGVAGGLAGGVNVGDVVVASGFIQHDMDASPLFPRYEVPLYARSEFAADAGLSADLLAAAKTYLASAGRAAAGPQAADAGPPPRIHHGLIASGDRFVCSASEVLALRQALPSALCVEMECAAVAQVCHDYGLPFAAIRTVSDRADDTAHTDFPYFLAHVAAPYAVGVMTALAARWQLQKLP